MSRDSADVRSKESRSLDHQGGRPETGGTMDFDIRYTDSQPDQKTGLDSVLKSIWN